MIDDKAWYMSKGVWGGVIAFLGVIATRFFGIQINADDQIIITNYLVTGIGQGAAMIGGLLAIWGRIKATKKIG